DLAVEQAVLRRNIADSFVNLGRRNQNLLGRQLDFITELESKETDPDTLANLFRLDHLATRMRRNAESLLVLAGVEPPRKWAAPVRLTDVIRAALGEVEDYQRVTVRGVEPATIVGSAAADVAHLLAELIENALVRSPPDQTVDIRGRGNGDGGYTLAIIDSGLGMSPEDLAAANRRLAGLESFTIAPSKYLGHYVAGNLAARHGIKVRLDNSPGNGITATVELPPTLLTTDTTNLAAPVTPPHGTPALDAAPVDEAAGAAAANGSTSAWPPPLPAPAEGDRSPAPSPWGPREAQVPPPSALGGPAGGPPAPDAEPAPPARTASGLVKRSPRGTDRGVTRPAVLDTQVLASIRHVTGNPANRASTQPPDAGAGAPGDGTRDAGAPPAPIPVPPPSPTRSWPAPPARVTGTTRATGDPGRPPLARRRPAASGAGGPGDVPSGPPGPGAGSPSRPTGPAAGVPSEPAGPGAGTTPS